MRSKIVIQKPTDTSVGLIGVDSLLEVYDNTKSGDLVVVYPGTYDLGANGIKLKDGVNFLFMPGVVINSTNPNGAFYDDGVEVHCTIQGSPKIINGAGAAINLTNQSSSCPLNNKNLTVQNLPDPVLFNEGDIVTVEGGATYRHSGTSWENIKGAISLTYLELAGMANNNELINGQNYLITDFRTRHIIKGTTDLNIGTVEPLIVTAISSATISCEAKSVLFPKEKIYYSLENDPEIQTDRGWIYRRIETERNISLPFDFRSVKFRRWDIAPDTWSSSSNYNIGDVVNYSGNLFLCLQDLSPSASIPLSNSAWMSLLTTNKTLSPTPNNMSFMDEFTTLNVDVENADWKDLLFFSSPTTHLWDEFKFSNSHNVEFLGDYESFNCISYGILTNVVVRRQAQATFISGANSLTASDLLEGSLLGAIDGLTVNSISFSVVLNVNMSTIYEVYNSSIKGISRCSFTALSGFITKGGNSFVTNTNALVELYDRNLFGTSGDVITDNGSGTKTIINDLEGNLLLTYYSGTTPQTQNWL